MVSCDFFQGFSLVLYIPFLFLPLFWILCVVSVLVNLSILFAVRVHEHAHEQGL